jgi:hypothetical protein
MDHNQPHNTDTCPLCSSIRRMNALPHPSPPPPLRAFTSHEKMMIYKAVIDILIAKPACTQGEAIKVAREVWHKI